MMTHCNTHLAGIHNHDVATVYVRAVVQFSHDRVKVISFPSGQALCVHDLFRRGSDTSHRAQRWQGGVRLRNKPGAGASRGTVTLIACPPRGAQP